MARDDDFEPKLGRTRMARSGKGTRYLQGVLKNVARATGSANSARPHFDGSRIGRGSGVGRVLHARDRYAAFRTRRVVVQTRLIRLKRPGLNAARMHLRYLERDSVTRDGLAGELYDAQHDRADGQAFLERSDGDRHQFRFIVSAEDGDAYDDLKPLVRRLMGQVEKDLGTSLDWVAVDHFDTAHPHTHIVLRGKDDRGKDLIIAREYIAHGMRERAAEIVSLDLGPRTDREIQNRLENEVEQERFTSIDRSLLRDADAERLIQATGRDSFEQSIRAGRLQKLGRLGLAEETAPGQWRLAEEFEPTLRAMGERGDIIKAIHREMTRSRETRAVAD
jgi:type IV secretory pathway VirD2 relaxase